MRKKHVTAQQRCAQAASVKKLREAAGYSIDQLAERTGLARSTIYRIENGDHTMELDTVITLSVGLGVPVAALLPA
jgi:transcriptional regulator with XRE-family HTH domain